MTRGPAVFGVDFSPVMQRAIAWVHDFIAPDRPIVLVHAIDVPPLPRFLSRLAPPALAASEVCPQTLARLKLVGRRSGATSAAYIARAGRADTVLRDVADEQGASLLVIAAHGVPMRPWKRVGTTTERLLRTARQSMLVVTGVMVGPPKRILVAVDDAAITPCVLSRAGALADTHGAELRAVHVLSPAAYSHLISAEAAEAADEDDRRRRIEADLAEEALRWLRGLWANARRHSHLHADVPHGDPADEILKIANDQSVDLIVIGRYGIGRVVPAILGSVVGSVVAGAPCPVLVVGD